MPSPSLQIGDYAPFACGVTGRKTFWSFEAQAGRASALLVLGNRDAAALEPMFAALARRSATFAALGVEAIGLVEADSPHARAFIAHPPDGLDLVFCASEVFGNWRFAGDAPTIVALDRAARIIGWTQAADPDLALETILDLFVEEPRGTLRDEPTPAPVLAIPHILDRGFCRELVAHFEAGRHEAGGMASIDADGSPFHKVDETKKKRRDLLLPPDDPFNARILSCISRVCAPELKKAFCFDATHIDRILIARYDDDGGKFLRHRDNSGANVAFRHFALSINLNEDYDGGWLVFPEYNDYRYRPTAGCGLVFSASLLHEASVVTKGSRYVVLTFLHNAALTDSTQP